MTGRSARISERIVVARAAIPSVGRIDGRAAIQRIATFRGCRMILATKALRIYSFSVDREFLHS
jgi:hypothetical protein